MAARQVPSGGNRNMLSRLVMGVGALLLLVVPAILFVLAISHTKDFHLPGTLLILSVVSGMALVGIGAALHD